ncbi:hypothetical protein TeGR_g2482 [Tetraparma gracilis]|uniref:Uncharacterized protein n=1 Tax=Tetraparma gracilis TaxID=2962635 RepID=A0ABQ6MD59_9STRA|nr:hypothetical protein TeGR_g2482 [Tetraparma gracilis]
MVPVPGSLQAQILELKRLQATTSDASKITAMQESIDSLQEQIDNPVADDDDDDDFDGQEEKANETNVVTPLLSPLNSPNSHGVGPKPRPMSARPQSARRRSVPNLNAIPEEWRQRNAQEAADLANLRRQPRKSISHTPRGNPRNLISPVAAAADWAAAAVRSIPHGSPEMKSGGENSEGKSDDDVPVLSLGSSDGGKGGGGGARFQLPQWDKHLDLDGYSSSESVSSVNSRDGPVARKKRDSRRKSSAMGALDDVIEETTVNVITNEATSGVMSLKSSVTSIPLTYIQHTFCTSGDFGFGHSLATTWIPTGIFPQACVITLTENIAISKVVVECSGVRRMKLAVSPRVGGTAVAMNSSDGGDSGVSVFKSPVLPLTSMNVAVRHTATPTIDILDTPRARRENRGDVKLDVDPFQKQVWSAGHLGVGHSPQPGVVKMGDSAGAWATHAFSLGGRDGRDASGGGGKGDVDDKWAVGGQRVRELSLVVEEGHEAQSLSKRMAAAKSPVKK